MAQGDYAPMSAGLRQRLVAAAQRGLRANREKALEGRLTILCGDPSCNNWGCSQEAIDAWNERQEKDARAFVRGVLGLPDQGERRD